MNGKEMQKERVQLFRDAANFKKTDRIPHFANVVTWKVFDAGYNLDQAMTNFDVLEETVVKFLEKYPDLCPEFTKLYQDKKAFVESGMIDPREAWYNH